MNAIKGLVNVDSSRDTYWARVLLKSQKNNNQTFLYVCASHEYLENELNTNEFNKTALGTWLDSVTKEWASKGNQIFRKPFHMEIHTLTEQGRKNAVDFLENEIIPTAL